MWMEAAVLGKRLCCWWVWRCMEGPGEWCPWSVLVGLDMWWELMWWWVSRGGLTGSAFILSGGDDDGCGGGVDELTLRWGNEEWFMPTPGGTEEVFHCNGEKRSSIRESLTKGRAVCGPFFSQFFCGNWEFNHKNRVNISLLPLSLKASNQIIKVILSILKRPNKHEEGRTKRNWTFKSDDVYPEV